MTHSRLSLVPRIRVPVDSEPLNTRRLRLTVVIDNMSITVERVLESSFRPRRLFLTVPRSSCLLLAC